MLKSNMPKILNISMEEARTGEHPDLGGETILIQITDYDIEPPITAKKYLKYYQFRFLDIEDKDECIDEYRITNKQATDIVNILKEAKNNNYNIIVHCYAGVSRSGAIVEFAINELGFEDYYFYRSPNQSILKLLTKIHKDGK